jgi:hypothetical protein
VKRDIEETNNYVTSAIELQTGWSTEATVEAEFIHQLAPGRAPRGSNEIR